MFWHNFSILCAGMGKSPNAVGKELGIPSGSITAWRKGSIPRGATIKKIADYFGVTVGDLLDGEEKEKPAGQTADGLDELEDDLIKAFRRLPDQMKESLLRKIQADAEFYGLPPRD